MEILSSKFKNKVFFISVSRIKKAEFWYATKGCLPNSKLKVFFIALSRIGFETNVKQI